MQKKQSNVLITGASTGIGYELSKVFLQHKYRVYGSVRKQEDADRLLNELGDGFHPLLFDITDTQAKDEVATTLTNEIGDQGLEVLVNNAGIAVPGPVLHVPLEDLRYQFEVNVIGQVKVIQAFAPLLGAMEETPGFPPGRILQISSVAGKISMPFMGPYAGSKHAFEGISNSLRRELMLYGIKVIIIGPGPVKTPIWNKSADGAEAKYGSTPYRKALDRFQNKFVRNSIKTGIDPWELAHRIFEIAVHPKPRVRYTFTHHKLRNWYAPRLLPERMMDNFIAKALKLQKAKSSK
jgi:hypothetical protein